jgi:hypothetical protein
MNRENRAILVVVLIIMVFVVTLISAVPAIDRWRYPRYHQVKLGMTLAEVEAIMQSSSDQWGNELGGIDSYYFTREGTITVRFDRNDRAVDKRR